MRSRIGSSADGYLENKTIPMGEKSGAPATPTNNASQDEIRDFMQGLLNDGVPPREVAQRTNQQFGLTTGNEAVYYEENNTLSIPLGYFAYGEEGWKFSERNGGRGRVGVGVAEACGRIARVAVEWAFGIFAKNQPTSRRGQGEDGGNVRRSATDAEINQLDAMFRNNFPN